MPSDQRAESKTAPRIARNLAVLGLVAGLPSLAPAQESNQLIQTTCIACHNEFTLQAGLNLQGFDAEAPHQNPVVAEKMIRKLRAGQMPPREMPRVDEAIMNLVSMLENRLDDAARTSMHGTPMATPRGDNKLIEYLLEKGADVKAVSRSGQTTADMANSPTQRVAPFPDTLAWLVSLGAVNNNNCVTC